MASNYGTDVFLGPAGLDPAFPLIQGPAVVAYSLFRRWTTSEKLPAFKGNSLDLTEIASDKLVASSLPGYEREMIRVAIFEPRLSTITVKLTLNRPRELLKVDARGALVTGETFPLIIDISLVSAQVVGISVL